MSQAPDLKDWDKNEIRETLDGVRHPVSLAIFGSDNYFNVGAIIRTAHIFLIREIILVDIPEFYERATMGTHKWENITHTTLNEFLNRHSPWSSADNRTVVGFERRPNLETKSLLNFQYPENALLCFGSEKTGLPESVIQLAQMHEVFGGGLVSIPQFGLQNDMNLANAVSIGVYDWTLKNYGKQARVE